MKKKKKILIPFLIILVIIGTIYCIFLKFFFDGKEALDITSTSYETIEIPPYASVTEIATILDEKNLIISKEAFIVRAITSGISGRIKSGTYDISPNMSVDDIIDALSIGDADRGKTITITIIEGETIEDIANDLYENNVIYNKQKFLEICKTGAGFEKHNALNGINLQKLDSETKYALEGYLFPDTYEFYINSTPYDVINKMLNRFNEIYVADYEAQAAAMGYSKQDVITIASIIEKESSQSDFSKVSAVIYNRLQQNMKLQVDSTIRYVKDYDNTISLTGEQYSYNSKYNTYLNKGLTPSPICNPSRAAIEAALNPNTSYVNDGYLYFCLVDYETKTTVFSKTYQEHLENVSKYKDNWQDYDKAITEK